jgi:hypothetical protein
MMRLQYGFIAMLLTNTLYAYTGFGVCNFGKEVVEAVICYSPAVLKQTTIKGDIKVTGSLKADSITARGMIIEGNVDIQNSQINGQVNVTGDFYANNVEFKKGVAVTGTDIVLNNSNVNSLMTITSTIKTPYLQVQCGSVISGSVLFSDKAGVVQITGDALVQGKVVNGSLEFVKRTCKPVSQSTPFKS